MPAPYPEPFRRSGKSVPVLARELGVSPQSLRNWACQIDLEQAASSTPPKTNRTVTRAVTSCRRGGGPRTSSSHGD